MSNVQNRQQLIQRGAIIGLVLAILFFVFSFLYIPTQADQSAVPLLNFDQSFVIDETAQRPNLGGDVRFIYDRLDEQKTDRENSTTTQVYTCSYVGEEPRVYTATFPATYEFTLPYEIESGVGEGTNFANDCKLTLKANPSSKTSLVLTDAYEGYYKYFNEFTEELSTYDIIETDIVDRRTHLVKFNSADQVPRLFSNNPQVDYYFLTDSFEINGSDCPVGPEGSELSSDTEACFDPGIRVGTGSVFINCITPKDNNDYLADCTELLDGLKVDIS